MRSNPQYLTDILEATRSIEIFLEGISREDFIGNDGLRSSVALKLMVIGEAANHLSNELCEKYPAIPWRDIIDNRHLIVHGYFSIDWEIIWMTATDYAIPLQEQIFNILETEFPNW